MVSKLGLSSGLSFQHLSISSIKSSGQFLRPTAGLKGGLSLPATLPIISEKKTFVKKLSSLTKTILYRRAVLFVGQYILTLFWYTERMKYHFRCF